MSLIDLFLMLKGGEGSGNWGHSGRPGKRGGSAIGTGGLARFDFGYDNPSIEARRNIAEIITKRRKRNNPSFFILGQYRPSTKSKTLADDIKAIIGNETKKVKQLGERLSKAEANYQKSIAELDHMKMRVDVSMNQRKALLDKLDRQADKVFNLQSSLMKTRAAINDKVKEKITTNQGDVETLMPVDYKVTQSAKEGGSLFNSLVSKDVAKNMQVPVRNQETSGINPENDQKGRAYHSDGEIYINSKSSPKTIVHELGHALEYNNPKVHERARAFLEMRTHGQPSKTLNELTGSKSFAPDEKAIPDKFPDPYVGKDYIYKGNRYATEVISMGVEYMASDPYGFYQKDPEYFTFMLDTMNGR